jgi:hypothetical protein
MSRSLSLYTVHDSESPDATEDVTGDAGNARNVTASTTDLITALLVECRTDANNRRTTSRKQIYRYSEIPLKFQQVKGARKAEAELPLCDVQHAVLRRPYMLLS